MQLDLSILYFPLQIGVYRTIPSTNRHIKGCLNTGKRLPRGIFATVVQKKSLSGVGISQPVLGSRYKTSKCWHTELWSPVKSLQTLSGIKNPRDDHGG
jgi:hypothetical protein